MRVLISFSCTNSSVGVQNQSFSQFVSLISVIFSNRKLQLIGNYIHKIVIKFAFSVVSELWTSRYVLIDFTRLTHFLCCNFVCDVLLDNISKFCECFGNPFKHHWHFNLTDGQLHHKYCCNSVLPRFSRMFSKLA